MTEYRVKGALFENTKGGPAFTGFVEIDGVKTMLALWPKVSAAGNDYLQVSEDKKQQQKYDAKQGNDAAPRAPAVRSPFQPKLPMPRNTSERQSQGYVRRDDMDDDVPFTPEFR